MRAYPNLVFQCAIPLFALRTGYQPLFIIFRIMIWFSYLNLTINTPGGAPEKSIF